MAAFCDGGWADCAGFHDKQSCYAYGCTWDDEFALCNGQIRCQALNTKSLCDSQWDCSWRAPMCTGTPEGCSGRELADCRFGCVWREGECQGTCEPCGDFPDQESCLSQVGCTWDGQGGGL